MSTLKVDTIQKADGTGSLSVPAESGTVVTTASPSLGRRNLIINGAMQVAQRGTSVTGVTGNVYGACDRFAVFGSAYGTIKLDQSTDAPDGFSNSLLTEITTASTSTASGDHLVVGYTFEGQDLQQLAYGSSGAKDVTISFYAKADSAMTTTVELYDNDNTYQVSKEVNITTSWAKYSVTFSGNTGQSFDNDNNLSLYLFFWLSGGTNFTSGTLNESGWASNVSANRCSSNTDETFIDTLGSQFYVTGVQLEVGSVATPFEHRSYGEELALCQRYYATSHHYHPRNTQEKGNMYNWIVPMRATPSLTYINHNSNGLGTFTVQATVNANYIRWWLSNNTDSWIAFDLIQDAEL